jgi:hypothetical protein
MYKCHNDAPMPPASKSQTPLTLQIHAHFREWRERKKTTYEFALLLIEDPQLPHNLVVLADVAPDLWKQKEEMAAPELCNQRNCTALPSCTTNLKKEGARDSAPPPNFCTKTKREGAQLCTDGRVKNV